MVWDRIQNLTATDKSFRYPKDFDPKRYFENSYGIMVDQKIPIEKVRIKVSADQRPLFQMAAFACVTERGGDERRLFHLHL
jgi:hypothetical protein